MRSTRSLGRFAGSTTDLDPLGVMISEIKGGRRERNLLTVRHESAEGNSSPQAAFEKLKGKSVED